MRSSALMRRSECLRKASVHTLAAKIKEMEVSDRFAVRTGGIRATQVARVCWETVEYGAGGGRDRRTNFNADTYVRLEPVSLQHG